MVGGIAEDEFRTYITCSRPTRVPIESIVPDADRIASLAAACETVDADGREVIVDLLGKVALNHPDERLRHLASTHLDHFKAQRLEAALALVRNIDSLPRVRSHFYLFPLDSSLVAKIVEGTPEEKLAAARELAAIVSAPSRTVATPESEAVFRQVGAIFAASVPGEHVQRVSSLLSAALSNPSLELKAIHAIALNLEHVTGTRQQLLFRNLRDRLTGPDVASRSRAAKDLASAALRIGGTTRIRIEEWLERVAGDKELKTPAIVAAYKRVRRPFSERHPALAAFARGFLPARRTAQAPRPPATTTAR